MPTKTHIPFRTIGEVWASYVADVLPAMASDVQREETKRAFYAGATAMFAAVLAASEPDDEAEAEARMDALDRELGDYLRLFTARHGL